MSDLLLTVYYFLSQVVAVAELSDVRWRFGAAQAGYLRAECVGGCLLALIVQLLGKEVLIPLLESALIIVHDIDRVLAESGLEGVRGLVT